MNRPSSPTSASLPRCFADRYGPWAIVTGASDGIGRACAHELAAAGLNLVLVARRQNTLDALAAEFARDHGIEARPLALDLGQPGAVVRLVHETRPLDVGLLITSAGYGTSGPLLKTKLADELDMLQVNATSVLELVHRLGPRLIARDRSGVVLLGSLVGFQGVPRAANYAATKAYVQSLAEALHHEWKPLGVDVLASAPGPVNSGFAARADMDLGQALTPATVARETLRALGRRSVVRPGFLSKFLEAALTLPRWARVRILALVMRGMTRHQESTRQEHESRDRQAVASA